jgi:thiosulfate dehydrogenase (quinone) large subunit
MKTLTTFKGNVIQDPPFIQTLFNNTAFAWLWLALRVWLGWQWVEAGLHKVESPAWTQTGDALKGFWSNIVVIPETGRPAIAFDWYRNFIQFMLDAQAYTWFAKLVAYGELTIGILLVLGAFTGIAAFLGGFMNWNFMMAGSASSNPMLFVAALVIIFAWKTAGYFGADYFLLRKLGTPWQAQAPQEKLQPVEAIPVSA